MGTGNSKENLYEAIDADDCAQAQTIIQANPGIINEPVSDESIFLYYAESKVLDPTTPLARAAWRGNVEMVYTLIELGADVNAVGPQQVSPLQWAAQRGKDETVDFLIQKGAKIDFVSKEKLTALDYAILYGSYNIAWKLMNLGGEPKDLEYYKAMAQEKHILFYDYEKFLDSLSGKVPLESCQQFNIPPPEPGFKDPVIDPRETWGQFAKRILEFEEPPLVERSDLPPELRPENRMLGKLRSFINGQSPYPEEGPKSEERPNIEMQPNGKPAEESVVLTSEEAKHQEDDEHASEKFDHVVDIPVNLKTASEGDRKGSGNEEVNSSSAGLMQQVVDLKPVQINVENRQEA